MEVGFVRISVLGEWEWGGGDGEEVVVGSGVRVWRGR